MIPDFNEVISYYPEFDGVHPACLAVPMIDAESFADMVEDIKENGLLEPLVRKDRVLLDGRTRLLACYASNTEIRVRDHQGSADPWTLVNEWNVLRRHLSVGQKASFTDAWREDVERAAKERQGERNDLKEHSDSIVTKSPDTGRTRKILADKVGVGEVSVDKYRKVRETAPDVAEKVKSNEITLEAGYKEARKREAASKAHAAPAKPDKPSDQIVYAITVDGKKTEIQKPKKTVFNQTTNAVDWARWTWNPVTGCHHGCKFCYAREIAHSSRMASVYPNQFEPTFHEYRLDAPANTNRPASNDERDGRVFVCSMADLFGKWVPDDWIEKVFASCLESPEWEYLFLTKWPARYATMPLLEKAWYGASVIQQSDVSRVEKAMANFETECVKWISLEPMLQPIVFNDLSWCNLVVIGSQTSTTQPEGYVPAFAPNFDWIVDVVNQCRDANVPYYLKDNLGMETPGMTLPKMAPRSERNQV